MATRTKADWTQHAAIAELIKGLEGAVGKTLRSVVLYGPAVRGEVANGSGELHILVVLSDLKLETLEAAGAPLARWVKRGLPMPRLFSPATLRDAADVFPIELGDIAERHMLLHGDEPLPSMPALEREHLRLQCERELREKMMRLEEAYALSRVRGDELRRLVVTSFPAFAMVFRGCLRLHGDPVPEGTLEAAEAFCRAAGIDPEAFRVAWRVREGVALQDGDFASYHRALERAVDAIDKFTTPTSPRSDS
jgi:hypothetical protein